MAVHEFRLNIMNFGPFSQKKLYRRCLKNIVKNIVRNIVISWKFEKELIIEFIGVVH